MHENQLASSVLDKAMKIHENVGPGLLESAYETILTHDLRAKGQSQISDW